MKILSPEEVRAFEDRVIAAGTPAKELMEAAGAGIAATLRREFPGPRHGLFFIGKGNNGGDGLLAAEHLSQAGWTVDLVHLEGEWSEMIPWPDEQGVVVDALLGIGAQGPLRKEVAEAVAAINRQRAARFFRTVAIDGPTGLHAMPHGEAIHADLTLCIGLGKERLFEERWADWVGRIEGIPIFEDHDREAFADRPEGLTREALRPLLPRRVPSSYKKDFGRVTVVGGSHGFIGAPLLSTLGALRSGAGLLDMIVRPEVWELIAGRAPLQAMVTSAAEEAACREVLEKSTVLAVGPGLGTDEPAAALLRHVLQKTKLPVVVDADGLTLLSRDAALLALCRDRAVLTPHPGEMERLLGGKFSPAERVAKAAGFAEQHGVVVLLKGCRTVIAEPGRLVAIALNTTGNPGLAAGGSGDLLTGIIAGLIGQKLSLGDAARLGAWLHGRAADLALRKRGAEEGLGAEEVAESLADAFVDLRSH